MTNLELAARMYKSGHHWSAIRNFINCANKYPEAWKRFQGTVGAFYDVGQESTLTYDEVHKFVAALIQRPHGNEETERVQSVFGFALIESRRESDGVAVKAKA